jgi:hypothetical protein
MEEPMSPMLEALVALLWSVALASWLFVLYDARRKRPKK